MMMCLDDFFVVGSEQTRALRVEAYLVSYI